MEYTNLAPHLPKPLTLSCPTSTFVDFTLSDARRFHSSMGNPSGREGLNTTSSKTYVPIFKHFPPNQHFCGFHSNARRFYLSMGNPLGRKGWSLECSQIPSIQATTKKTAFKPQGKQQATVTTPQIRQAELYSN